MRPLTETGAAPSSARHTVRRRIVQTELLRSARTSSPAQARSAPRRTQGMTPDCQARTPDHEPLCPRRGEEQPMNSLLHQVQDYILLDQEDIILYHLLHPQAVG